MSVPLPDRVEQALTKGRALAWGALVFQLTAVVLVYMVMGGSQAMKAAWVEDALGLVPPIVFLIAQRIRRRDPNQQFPYGYERVTMIAFVIASTALLLMGTYVVYDSATKLIEMEHTTIGTQVLFGHQIWAGWLMVAVMAYTIIPAVLLGRKMEPVARRIHDKSLFAEGAMLRADWMTAAATIIGIIGVGAGLWWADAAVALYVGLDIVHDGVTYVKGAFRDLMDSSPTKVDRSGDDELPAEVRDAVASLDVVDDVAVRFREEGHVLSGEIWVRLRDDVDTADGLRAVGDRAREVSWRVHDVVVTVAQTIDGAVTVPGDDLARSG